MCLLTGLAYYYASTKASIITTIIYLIAIDAHFQNDLDYL